MSAFGVGVKVQRTELGGRDGLHVTELQASNILENCLLVGFLKLGNCE